MPQGGISKVLRHIRETGRAIQRPHGYRLTTPREDSALKRIMRRNRFLSSSRIRVELVRQTGRRVSARTVQRRMVRCPRMIQDDCRRHRVWAHGHRNWNQQQHWSHVIFADESRFSLYRVDERLVDCCIQETDGNVGPSPMEWVLSMHQANRSWWWWMVRSTSIATLVSCAKISLPGLGQPSKEILCLYMTMPHPYCTKYTQFSSGWQGGGWRHFVAFSETWSKTHRTYLEPDEAVYQKYG